MSRTIPASVWWPRDYFASREKFVDQATSCGARLESHEIDALGPDGQSLSIEVASIVSSGDERCIVLSSGVHGVEGFVGAAVQNQALELLSQKGVPSRTSIIFIHAVNPWGYAHCRRVNENNIDVNRNFFNFSTSHPSSPGGYRELDSIINAKTALGYASEINYWLKAGKLIAQHRGIEKLAGPIAAGQCDFPQGLFYSGTQISASCSLIQRLISTKSAGIEHVTILDVHSGLGPSGVVTLIGNTNQIPQGDCVQRLGDHFQQAVVMDTASGNAYNARGSWSQWCQQTLSDKQYLYLCIEIGTVNPMKVFSALRRENQAHHWTEPGSKAYMQTKQALLDAFAPRSPDWRSQAVAQGLQSFMKALEPVARMTGSTGH